MESMPLFKSVVEPVRDITPPTKTAARRRHLGRGSYSPPEDVGETTLGELLDGVRSVPATQQRRLGFDVDTGSGMRLWYAGDPLLAARPCVAIVGTRKVSPEGAARARRLARAMAEAGVVVVSGLAAGVDTEAMRAAMEAGGHTIGVIGTPLSKAYPAANKHLQEQVYIEHLLISQFSEGSRVFLGNFPSRNKLMAALSDATVIIEAGDTSGTLHQAAECTRLQRWLFIAKAVAEDPSVKWPASFLGHYGRAKILAEPSDVLKLIVE